MKNFLILIVLFLVTSTAFSANIGDDKTNIGQKGSAADKLLIFRDANKSHIQVDHTNGYFSFGDGTNSINKRIGFDIGLGASNPFFEWDVAKNKIRFSNDGAASKDIGSGTGGGGENFNNAFTADDNANAEDGTSEWTNTGTGEFTSTALLSAWVTSTAYVIGDVVTESGLIYICNTAHTSGVFATDIANWDVQVGSEALEGDQSFVFIPSAQNDEVFSGLLDFDKDIFKGRGCEASLEYIGGDTNLDLLVVDGNGDILNALKGTASTEGNNRTLPVHTISAIETVTFICPSQADIVGDSLKGDIRFKLKNVGASASALIKFDKNYKGTLQSLSETTLPDVFSATVNGTGTITEQSGDWLASVSHTGTGQYTLNFNAGYFSTVPSLVANINAAGFARSIAINTTTTTSALIEVRNSATHALEDRFFNIVGKKQGADAKQTVQVLKLVPKVSEHINELSLTVSTNGTVISKENVDWASTTTVNGTGDYDINVNSGIDPTALNCVFTGISSSDKGCTLSSLSASAIGVKCFDPTGAAVHADVEVMCQKAGADYKTAGIQNISLGGLTVNSYAESSQKNVRVESCFIGNAGTPAATGPLCDSWISSISDNGVGLFGINVISGIFSTVPSCTFSGYGTYTTNLTGTVSATLIETNTALVSTGALTDRNVRVICQGAR